MSQTKFSLLALLTLALTLTASNQVFATSGLSAFASGGSTIFISFAGPFASGVSLDSILPEPGEEFPKPGEEVREPGTDLRGSEYRSDGVLQRSVFNRTTEALGRNYWAYYTLLHNWESIRTS